MGKPENVLIAVENSNSISNKSESEYRREVVKIIDFGFSKVMDSPFAASFMGTGGFLAPEMCDDNARYTAAVDIWALGVTLYIIISCCLPFDRSIRPKPY